MPAAPRPDAAPDPRLARTRRRVLGAAWEVLAEVGVERVTIELISERSGVARSTMYRHWQTREEILRDAFAERARPVPPGAPLDPDTPHGAREQLVAYAVAYAVGLEREWGRAAVTMASRGLDEPDQRRAVLTFVEGNVADLRDIAARGLHEGALPAETDPATVAAALVDLVLAPLFYRYLVLGQPADGPTATVLAERGWRCVGGARD